MREFTVNTKQNKVLVKAYYEFTKKEDVKTNRELFSRMCRTGCINYENKFSCPPHSPSFENIAVKEGIFVLMFLVKLNQIKSSEYNKVRIANSIMKSRIDKLMRKLEEKFYTKFLSTGSCRLCKICNLQNKLGCRHPDKMRYSLEATSVDCDFLSKRLFNIPLLWFREEKAPEYSCVLAGLICNFMDVENIKIELESLLKNIA